MDYVIVGVHGPERDRRMHLTDRDSLAWQWLLKGSMTPADLALELGFSQGEAERWLEARTSENDIPIIMDPLQRRGRRFLVALGAAPDVAEEICSSAWLEVLIKLREQLHVSRHRFPGYYRGIVRNRWLDRLRTERRHARLAPHAEDETAATPVRLVRPDAHTTLQRRSAALDGCLDALTAKLRQIVDHYYVEGRPLSRFAAKVGRSTSWVTKQHLRALRLLKGCLERKGWTADGG